jgi:hypothetical protein
MHAEPFPPSRLRDAFRIVFLLPVPPERMHASWGAILAAALLTVAVPTVYSFAVVGTDGMFSPAHLIQALSFFTLSVVLAIVLGATTRRPDLVQALLFATLVAGAIIDAANLVVWEAVRTGAAGNTSWTTNQVFWVAPLVWLAVAMARFALPLHPRVSLRMVPTALAALFVVSLPSYIAAPERSLWVKDWSKEREDPERMRAMFAIAHEDAFYAQARLLAEALDAVQPGRPGLVDLFFVGVAGYGRQDVFRREVDAVTRLMEERFDAEGRTIRLINNPNTVLESPVASLTSVKAALGRVAERMDVQEDVLVLFLTSHGSDDHRFSLDLPPLRFDTLDPAALRQALDESGIRNRVVIVSACYSGGFASPLADPHTMVITAAAPDRNSFGCSNEADWTYFGRAYFDEALRTTRSFTEAFEKALPVVAAREAVDKYPPSNPMMVGGEALAGTLKRLEQRLVATTAAASKAPARTAR